MSNIRFICNIHSVSNRRFMSNKHFVSNTRFISNILFCVWRTFCPTHIWCPTCVLSNVYFMSSSLIPSVLWFLREQEEAYDPRSCNSTVELIMIKILYEIHKFVQPPQISYRKWVLKLSTLRNPQNGDTLPNLFISPVSTGHLVLGLQYCYCSMSGGGLGVVWQHTWHCELVSAAGGAGEQACGPCYKRE